ncbi:MAG TPA: DinB family protein [Gemmatimonadaceae bacterium]|nr:DinB family protein [Gemmatimonadaceae bacterium]
MAADDALREQMASLLDWHAAHATFEQAVGDMPPRLRGMQPADLPYSPWQLLEHIRLAQDDILDFCRNPDYAERRWPEDYWPPDPEPPSPGAWDECVEAVRRDRAALQALARDASIDLFAKIPHGTGQTYLRELLLAADHASYHVGELVVVRRLLGAWPGDS